MNSALLRNILIISLSLKSLVIKSQLNKIYLNPKTIETEKQSRILDSIGFIPLEVREGIQLGSLSNMEITEELFIIKDYLNKTLLLYSKNGNFLKKISYKKLGDVNPGYIEKANQIVFFGYNKNYFLTPKDQIKITLDWDNPRNRKYFKKFVIDLNDTLFTIKRRIPDQNDISNPYHFYDDYYIHGKIATSNLYKDSLDYEIKLYKNTQLVKSFFPYNHISEPRFLYTQESISLLKTDIPFIQFICRPYCDTIYKIVKDSLFAAYQLVLPLENSLPPSFFTKPFKNKAEFDNFKRNNGWMLHQVFNFYETPKFIFFLVSYLSNYESYVYQKQNNTIYKTKSIKSDSSQYNLQLLSDFNILRKGDWFYKPQKAGDLLTFFEQNKNAAVPKELESFIKSKPPATTPVIVTFKFKN
jgi:hypothetical protein